MANNLTILTVAENTGELLDLMLTSVFKYTSPAPKVIVCNNGKTDEYIKKWSARSEVKIIDNKPSMSGGSNRHGEGLQKIFKLVNTPKVAILDSDTVLLSDKWNKFDMNEYDLIGLERGTESGSKGKAYYHMCFVLMNTDCIKSIDFRPGNAKTRRNGRSYHISEDVGWMIKNFVNTDRIKLLKFVNLKEKKGIVFDNSFCSVEIHLKNSVVAAHFGRGSNIRGKIDRKGFDTSKDQVKKWVDIAKKYIA